MNKYLFKGLFFQLELSCFQNWIVPTWIFQNWIMAVSLGRFRINLCTKLFKGRFFFNLNFLFGLFLHKFSKIGLWQRPLCRFWINLWTNISFNDLFLLYEFLLFEIGLFQYEFSKTGLRLWALLFDQTANVYFVF